MTGDVRTKVGHRRRWAGRAAMCWAVAYAVFGLACAVNGTSLLPRGGAAGASASGWGVVVLGAVAALVCGAVVRYGLRPALRALLWGTCGCAVIAAFGLLMDVVTLMFGQAVDSWAAATQHALAAVGAVLLAGTARSDRRTPEASSVGAPSAASRPLQLGACAGTVAFHPYVVMKLIWVSGGTFAGVSGGEMLELSEANGASGIWLALESWGLDATVLLAALGVFLLWGLVRPWGQVFPRWLPLVPAVIGAATLLPYGVIGVGYAALATAGVVTMRRGDFPSSDDALLVAWIGMVAFAAYGVALAAAARSYWRRTQRT
ncbi:hypothetical protein ACH4E8_23230 [Streptomyces sp. NPDC017979]|uniref:hypothetical protein n=1 Tax=Streptomyces sp. NPDC017979 TaxID=3365024 RepID=UPI003788A9AD